MVESIRPQASASLSRAALFDFDGTLSLIRTGWMQVMIPMMTGILADLRTGETDDQLRAVIEEYVWRLTGKETIYQMMALAGEVTRRGGIPLPPLEYKRQFLDRLWTVIHDRVDDLRAGGSPEKYLVPGSIALLESLRARGLRLYLASGTDEIFMKEEARLLGLEPYFDGGIYGALDDPASFSKRILVRRILESPGMHGEHLLSFGDGYVEIEEVKQVGGVAVGVATDEPECRVVDEWKRQRLIGAGADYIVPNYVEREALLGALFSGGAA